MSNGILGVSQLEMLTQDGTGTITIVPPATNTDRTLTFPDETGTIALAQASYVRLNTANGYGSTNTVIRRFTNVVNSVGSDITYADSATLGATFTINTAGVYSVSYGDVFTSGASMGISISSTQLTTNIAGITAADRLMMSSTTAVNVTCVASATFYAAANSVIRAHTDAAASNATPDRANFTIARVA